MITIKRKISIFAIALVTLLVCACTNTPHTRISETRSLNTTAHASSSPPANAEQLLQRLLKLIERLQTPEDLSLAQVQLYIGASIQQNQSDSSQFSLRGRVHDRWTYSLETVESSYHVSPHALRLRFDDGRDNTSDMSVICLFDYEQYKSSLERMGFDSRVITGNTRSINFNHDSGSGLHAIVYVRRENAANQNKKCVDMIVVDFRPSSSITPHDPSPSSKNLNK